MQKNQISESTRRNIVDYLLLREQPFHGKLDLLEFLKRVWHLSSMPSTDPRFQTAEGDIRQHMVNNDDWQIDYLFGSYLDLYTGDDKVFLKFVEHCVHPRVIADIGEIARVVPDINRLLECDGYELFPRSEMAGWPVYRAQELHSQPDGAGVSSTRSQERRTYRFLPLTLRLETLGGIATPLVLRGTALPARRSEVFTTAVDNQETVEVRLLLGESPLAKNNRELGRFALKGIRKATKGVPQIRVTFDVDQSTRVRATAADLESRTEVHLDADVLDGQLTEDMIQSILRSNEGTRAQDERELQLIEAANRAETAIANAEAKLKSDIESGNTSPGSKQTEQTVAKLGLALEAGDLDAIRQHTSKLESTALSFDGVFDMFFGPKANQSEGRAEGSATEGGGAPTQHEPTEGVATSITSAKQLGKVFGGGEFTLDPSLCFVLMPFSDDMRPVYEDHIKPVIEGQGLSCLRADEIVGTSAITRDIWENTNRARVLIADMTRRNPNVFYELGLAHALGKDVVLLTQDIGDVPFDLQSLRCIVYNFSPRGMRAMEEKLRSTVQLIMGGADAGRI